MSEPSDRIFYTGTAFDKILGMETSNLQDLKSGDEKMWHGVKYFNDDDGEVNVTMVLCVCT